MYIPPDTSRRSAIRDMILDTLGDDYLNLSLTKLDISENIETKNTLISYKFISGDQEVSIENVSGMGATDAFFKSVVDHYKDLSSIRSLQLKSFDVKADLLRSEVGTDAKVSVKTEFCNGYQCATFMATDYSISAACCKCILNSIEYFLNSESAFKKMKLIIEDAKNRNRSDIVSKYEYRLASLVNSNIAEYEGV